MHGHPLGLSPSRPSSVCDHEEKPHGGRACRFNGIDPRDQPKVDFGLTAGSSAEGQTFIAPRRAVRNPPGKTERAYRPDQDPILA